MLCVIAMTYHYLLLQLALQTLIQKTSAVTVLIHIVTNLRHDEVAPCCEYATDIIHEAPPQCRWPLADDCFCWRLLEPFCRLRPMTRRWAHHSDCWLLIDDWWMLQSRLPIAWAKIDKHTKTIWIPRLYQNDLPMCVNSITRLCQGRFLLSILTRG